MDLRFNIRNPLPAPVERCDRCGGQVLVGSRSHRCPPHKIENRTAKEIKLVPGAKQIKPVDRMREIGGSQ